MQPGDVQTAKDVALEEKISTVLEKNKALEKEKAQLGKENSRLKQSKETFLFQPWQGLTTAI